MNTLRVSAFSASHLCNSFRLLQKNKGKWNAIITLKIIKNFTINVIEFFEQEIKALQTWLWAQY